MAYAQETQSDVTRGDSAAHHDYRFFFAGPFAAFRIKDVVNPGVFSGGPLGPRRMVVGTHREHDVLGRERFSFRELDGYVFVVKAALHCLTLDVQVFKFKVADDFAAVVIKEFQARPLKGDRKEPTGPILPFPRKALQREGIKIKVVDRRRAQVAHPRRGGTRILPLQQLAIGVNNPHALARNFRIGQEPAGNVYPVNPTPMINHSNVMTGILPGVERR